MDTLNEEHIPYRVAEWLPSDHSHLKRWLDAMIRKTDAGSQALHPVIAEFQDLIESDAEVFMLFHQMFEQVPKRAPYHNDPTGKPQVRDYRQLVQQLNTIFDWSMGTAAGMAAFLNQRVNAQLKKVLNAWAPTIPTSVSCASSRSGWPKYRPAR
jgi:phosphatidylserine decarboxylase